MEVAAAQETARSKHDKKQEGGRLCLPDCLGGLQPEEGACLLAGDVALGLPLPHHQGLQLQIMHWQQSGLGTKLTLLNTITDCNGLCFDSRAWDLVKSLNGCTAHAFEHTHRLQWIRF